MPRVDRFEEEEADPEQGLPEGTETVIWAGQGDFKLNNPSDYPEECFPEEIDLSPVEGRVRGMTDPTIAFEPGEEIPLPVARDLWADWQGCMAALDGDGNRLDDSTRRDFDPDALERWRIHNEE